MNKRIQRNELLELMESLTPEEINHQYGDRLDADSQQCFADFQSMTKDLAGFPVEMGLLAPDLPRVAAPEKGKVFHMRRRWRLPAWSLPLTAAATFMLGFLLPRPEVVKTPDLTSATNLERTRTFELSEPGPKFDKDQLRFDRDIANSFFERGAFFYELGNQESYRKARQDFEMAFNLNNKDERALDYLIITSEELGDSDAKALYEGLRTKLGQSGKE